MFLEFCFKVCKRWFGSGGCGVSSFSFLYHVTSHVALSGK